MDSTHALLLTETLPTKEPSGTGKLPARESNISIAHSF
jgi:hypothetical protein